MGKTKKCCPERFPSDISCTREALNFQSVTHPVELTLKKQKKSACIG